MAYTRRDPTSHGIRPMAIREEDTISLMWLTQGEQQARIVQRKIEREPVTGKKMIYLVSTTRCRRSLRRRMKMKHKTMERNSNRMSQMQSLSQLRLVNRPMQNPYKLMTDLSNRLQTRKTNPNSQIVFQEIVLSRGNRSESLASDLPFPSTKVSTCFQPQLPPSTSLEGTATHGVRTSIIFQTRVARL